MLYYNTDGFRLCDGEKGTPDLRDRFPIGAGGMFDVGDSGGNFKITLSPDQLPSHYHGISDDKVDIADDGLHKHKARGDIKEAGDHRHGSGWLKTEEDGDHQHAIDFEADGGAHAHGFDLKAKPAGLHTHELKDIKTKDAGDHTHDDDFYVGKDDSEHYHPVRVAVKDAGEHSHQFDLETDKEEDHNHGAGWLKVDPNGDHKHQIAERETSEDG